MVIAQCGFADGKSDSRMVATKERWRDGTTPIYKDDVVHRRARRIHRVYSTTESYLRYLKR